MFEQVKKRDEDNREEKDGEGDARVGPEVKVGEVEGGHYGEGLHLAEEFTYSKQSQIIHSKKIFIQVKNGLLPRDSCYPE